MTANILRKGYEIENANILWKMEIHHKDVQELVYRSIHKQQNSSLARRLKIRAFYFPTI